MNLSSCVQGSICFELIKGVPTAVAALVIGLIAAYVAWKQKDIAHQQKEIAHAKLKLDLFDRRFNIFKKVHNVALRTYYYGAKREMFVEAVDFPSPFQDWRLEVAFLFGDEIAQYVGTMSHNWAELFDLHSTPKDQHTAEQKEIEKKLISYFLNEANAGVKDRFSPFLDFANWK